MKRNIMLINLAAAIIWLSMYSYVPVLPAYAATVGADVVMIGLLGGVYGVFQIALRTPLGLLSDKLGRDRGLLILGFFVLLGSNLIFQFLGNDIVWLIIARAAAGAAAAWWVVICAAYARYHDGNSQVKSQGKLSAWANGGKVIAALLCAVITMFAGYRSSFLIALISGAVGLALMFGVKNPPKPTHKPVKFKDQMKLFKNRDLMIFCMLAILSQLLCFGVPTTFTPVLAELMGAGSFELGMLMLVFFLTCTVASLFMSTRAYKKLGGINTLAISFALGAISCLPFFYSMGLAQIYIMQAISGVCYGITQGALAGFVIKSVPETQRGAATGIYQTLFGAGILLGPVIMGFVIDSYSFDAAYIMMAILMAISVALCYILIPKKYDKMT